MDKHPDLIKYEIINEILDQYCQAEYGMNSSDLKSPEAKLGVKFLKSMMLKTIRRYEEYGG